MFVINKHMHYISSMKKLIYISIILLFCKTFAYSQTNLVPNPSFEQYTQCPNFAGQIGFVDYWFQPTTGTPDYFNSCASAADYVNIPITFMGNTNANTGSAIAGEAFFDNVFATGLIYREYIAVKLLNTLTNNQKYFVTYYLKLADSSRYSTYALSVFFSNDSISKNTYDTISATPQVNNTSSNFIVDKLNWTKMRGSFIANGTENYMYLGNFSAQISNDTLFVPGGGTQAYNNFPYYFFDDICVSLDSSFSENWIKLDEYSINTPIFYPNPVEDFLFLRYYSNNLKFQLFDIRGDQILIERNQEYFDLSFLKPGMYFFKCYTSKLKSQTFKLIKK